MGDIILGTFLIIVVLVLLVLYLLLTRKNPGRRSLKGFISIVTLSGSLLGLLFTSLNKPLPESSPGAYIVGMLFFMTQAVASILYLKKINAGLSIVMLTLLLQIPRIHSARYSYRNQTLTSFVVAAYPGKILDIEPGSYVRYFSTENETPVKPFPLGVNLLPILTIFIYSRREPGEVTC